jgi:hypothetical protein
VKRRRPLALVLSALLLTECFGFQPLGWADDAGDSDRDRSDSFLSRHRKALLIVTGSGAAATGLAAYVYRRAANERFEDYQHTADPVHLAELYDEASDLDNRAAACFLVGEALFVFALYLGFFVDSPPQSFAPQPQAAVIPAIGTDGRRWMLRWSF